MNIRAQSHTFVMISFLACSWKFEKVSGLETTIKTWKEAILDCYGNNSFLESNVTVLQKYLLNHNNVNDSVWVGSFEALLPWIEIRGCYNIPLKCNSLEKDETNAANLQLCQVKCMKRRYFAFNQKNERCVCFDEHNIVKKETDNASYCQELIDRGDSNTHAVVYKVFDGPLTLAGYNHDCLFYKCYSNGSKLTFSTKECYTSARSYCRDGQRAVGPVYQLFQQYRGTCEEQHFTYPLLYSENPLNLCNVSESLILGKDIWVGVYRPKLYIDNSDKAVIQDFDRIEQFILRCDHLPGNGGMIEAENCSRKHHYKCASDASMESQKEPYNSSTSSPVCRAEESDTGETDIQSSGTIAGIVLLITVIIVIIFVKLAFMYRRTYAKENASLITACREDLHINNMSNNTVMSNYQQLDNVDDVQKITNTYDQLHVTRNVDTDSTNDQANTSFSRDEYSRYEYIVGSNGIDNDTDILEYEQFDNSDKDRSTHAYDQLNVRRVVKIEPTSFFSKTTASREHHSNDESTKATTDTSEYVQLDHDKIDKGANVYDQLHVTDMINTDPTYYNSKTRISREQKQETTHLNSMTVTSEYEQLNCAIKDKCVNVYNQLDATDMIDIEQTNYNSKTTIQRY